MLHIKGLAGVEMDEYLTTPSVSFIPARPPQMVNSVLNCDGNSLASLLVQPISNTCGGQTMFKATLDIAEEIAHDLNVRREFVWEIIKGMRYNSVEELEIRVCKAIAGH